MDMMHVDVGCSNPKWDVTATDLKEAAEKALLYYFEKLKSESNHYGVHLDINLVDEEIIGLLNEKYKDKSGPATVLSFPADDRFSIKNGQSFLGEIYLSPVTIKKRSGDIIFYMVHGLLHLLGFSHKTQNDRMDMEKFENDILNFLSKDNESN